MKKMFVAALISGLLPCLAQAQCGEYFKGHGYYFFGVGQHTNSPSRQVHLGGGGEYYPSHYVGVGGEAAWISRYRPNFGVFSANLVARSHAKGNKTKLEPFFSGGYTLTLVFHEAQHGINFGGGLSWWMNDRVGLRFEVRDYVPGALEGMEVEGHFVGVHIGMTFRWRPGGASRN